MFSTLGGPESSGPGIYCYRNIWLTLLYYHKVGFIAISYTLLKNLLLKVQTYVFPCNEPFLFLLLAAVCCRIVRSQCFQAWWDGERGVVGKHLLFLFFLKIFYFIRKYLEVLVWFCLIGFFWAGEKLILPLHSRAGVWIFLSSWVIFEAYLPICVL